MDAQFSAILNDESADFGIFSSGLPGHLKFEGWRVKFAIFKKRGGQCPPPHPLPVRLVVAGAHPPLRINALL
jgi:hypothetical protein